MSGRDKNRPARVAEQIRGELMDMVLRGEVRDPAAAGVVVSNVQISPDLRHARVFLRATGGMGEAEPDAVVAAMRRAGGYLRREIGRRLQLRHTPELVFEWDEVVDRALRIETLLDEVRREPRRGEDE